MSDKRGSKNNEHQQKWDTEFATLHDGKVTDDRFEGYNPPFDTVHGWFSNNWRVDEHNGRSGKKK